MNRNQLFANVHSDIDINRSKFPLTQRRLTTFNQGELVPIYVNCDILAGDTFDVSTLAIVRSRTPLTPVFGNAKLDTYWFFVPDRLVWKHTEEFYGDSNPSAYYAPTDYHIPALGIGGLADVIATAKTSAGYLGDDTCHTLYDQMALPLYKSGSDTSSEIPISVLPFRAYKLIWNEWFRDENLQDPQFVNDGDTPTYAEYYPVDEDGNFIPFLRASKIHDLFTSALPAPQKGLAVQIPLLGSAPVFPGETDGVTGPQNKVHYRATVSGTAVATAQDLGLNASGELRGYGQTNGTISAPGNTVYPANFYADLSKVDAVSVSALRLAIAAQHILERSARSGSRFPEFLRSFFGIITPESVLQLPQYLGGQTFLINNNQVLQTSASESNANLGETGAYSYSRDYQHSFTKSFGEPGTLMCLAVVRVEHDYEQRIDRMWTRSSFFDRFTPPLAHLGEQQLKNYEVHFDFDQSSVEEDGEYVDKNAEGFGYIEAWNQYRCGINEVTGEMRPSYANPGMRPWSYTDYYTDIPKLSPAWIQEGSENVNQTLAVSSNLADQFFGLFFFNIDGIRPLPLTSDPGLSRM